MKFLKLFLLPFAFLCVGLIRLASRWRVIRIGDLWSSRLGHLIGNTECYLCERDAGFHDGFLDIWYSQSQVANRLIEKKYRQRLHTAPASLADLTVKINRLFRGFEKHEVRSTQFDRDVHNLWEKYSPHIGFTEEEERKGKRLLKELGIEGKWVCLIIRDPQYLKTIAPQADFSYHDYRDSSLLNYVPAVLELIKRGYTVLRMGHHAEKPFGLDHPKFIDYAFKHRTDFGDLYLGAKCEFCVGTSTGFIAIPQAFHRPICFVNHAPLEYSPTFYEKGLMIWKHHVKDGKRMSLAEIFASGAGQFTFRQQFEQLGITLIENTEQEILEAVSEMADNIDNVPWNGTQPEFWSKFPLTALSPYNGNPIHGKPRLRIGREFLKGYA